MISEVNVVNYFFGGGYDLKSLPDMLDFVSQSINVISRFEVNIRSIMVEIPGALSEARRFVSKKLFVSLQSTQWSFQKLLENTSPYIMPFHSTMHMKQVLMSQLQYAREFMRSVKEALKISHLWPAYYFTNRKGSWYPAT